MGREAPLDTRATISIYLPLVITYQGTGMRALGDPTRRAIFELLADGPCPVGEIARQLPVTRPAVSQHLKVLKEAGLVSDSQVGTRRLYRLNPEGVGALRAYFDQFWNQALAAFKQSVEQTNNKEEQ
jgi:DNA-binding transcriptional ArsR family regulator